MAGEGEAKVKEHTLRESQSQWGIELEKQRFYNSMDLGCEVTADVTSPAGLLESCKSK